jgi:DNA-binding HxlR family transcriptional regulator
MRADALIRLLPSKSLERLAVSTNVDHYTKKLQGEVIFKLLLYCLLSRKENSLRTMRSAYESMVFQSLKNRYPGDKISHSSISERLSSIEVSYFEQLFKDCVSAYKNLDGIKTDNLLKFDSTIVALSANLLNVGYHLPGGSAAVKQLKFTIGYSDIPEIVHFYHDQQFTSENIALRDTIINNAALHDLPVIRVFDRGITSRNTYDTMTEKGIFFVSRLNDKAIKSIVSSNDLITASNPVSTDSLYIVADQWCYLFSSKKKSEYPVRCIEAYKKKTNEKLMFVTNIKDTTAQHITDIYKKRWDIEVFFKFLKQVLNFNHLTNRSENGIQVMLYVTMIAAILLEAYKKTNKLTGFKIPMQLLDQDLEKEITKSIVILCGGNPDTFDDLFGNKSP